MVIKVLLVKAFTTYASAGNPAGVIISADNLSTIHMQKIATELGFSESVFVLRSEVADYKMRYFSPTQEVDYCAHATIAACYVLKNIKSHETRAGTFRAEFDKNDNATMLWQKDPVFGHIIPKEKIAPLLGINVEDFYSSLACQIVSTGVPKLIIPLLSRKALFDIQPDLEGIKKFCQDTGTRGFYPFTQETIFQNAHFHARQFNPLSGINEDPITGIAAGALGAYWVKVNHLSSDNPLEFCVEQGHIMNKFGVVYVHVDTKLEKPIVIRGQAVVFGEMTIMI